MNNYCVYLLVNTCNSKTYIGITNNKQRRLRQHNGDLVGGAKYTTANKQDGQWVFFGWITGTSDSILEKNRALSIEKKIKIMSRKLSGTISPVEPIYVLIPENAPSPLIKRLKAITKILDQNSDLIFEQ